MTFSKVTIRAKDPQKAMLNANVEVLLDGVPLICTGVNVRLRVGELPRVTFTMPADLDLTGELAVKKVPTSWEDKPSSTPGLTVREQMAVLDRHPWAKKHMVPEEERHPLKEAFTWIVLVILLISFWVNVYQWWVSR